MSEVEFYPGRVPPLDLGTVPHADMLKYAGLELLQRIVDGKLLAFGTETCSIFPAANLAVR